jgi:5'-methylthioadenosine phosphorylase
MRVGIITGSGSYAWPGLTGQRSRQVETGYGAADVTVGRFAGVDVVHLSRHGSGHSRLSNHVPHKANLAALRACEVDAVISLTVCGGLDPDLPLGSLIAFDDRYFPSNRLPDGSLCTWCDTVGQPGRGHWIFD